MAAETSDFQATLAIDSTDPERSTTKVALSAMAKHVDPPVGELTVTPPHQDFGADTVGIRSEATFTLENTGTGHVVIESSSLRGSGTVPFEGFTEGRYVWDPRVPVETTSNPDYPVSGYGHENAYWYEPSGAHGMSDPVDREADFAVLRDYVIANAGAPIVPTGPFDWDETSTVSRRTEATFTYFLCDSYIPPGRRRGPVHHRVWPGGRRHPSDPQRPRHPTPRARRARAAAAPQLRRAGPGEHPRRHPSRQRRSAQVCARSRILRRRRDGGHRGVDRPA